MKKLTSILNITLTLTILLGTSSADGMDSKHTKTPTNELKKATTSMFFANCLLVTGALASSPVIAIGAPALGLACVAYGGVKLMDATINDHTPCSKPKKIITIASANNYSDEEILEPDEILNSDEDVLDSDEGILDSDESIYLVCDHSDKAPLLLLPKETLIHIAGYSEPEEKTALMQVCKDLNTCLKDTEALVLENSFTVSKTDKVKSMFDCIRSGKTTMITFLLNAGVKANRTNKNGMSFLYSAVQTGNLNTIQLLINAGADVNRSNSFNEKKGHAETALHCALSHNKIDVANLLITHGADINHANFHNHNNSILYCASKEGNLDVVTLALNLGADPDQANGYEDYPLHVALEHIDMWSTSNHTDIAKLLITHGAEVNQVNCSGDTPLDIAAEKDIDIVKLLIARGADVNQGSPLRKASRNDQYDIVEFLIGADAQVQEDALYVAVYFGHIEIVKLLIKHGADVHWIDSCDDTLPQIARERGHTEIAELLEK